jgi:nucleotidyltransferase/DNA polymerase involved in DNA repair
MCSKEAAQKGITAGMRLFEAQALCADLVLRESDQDLYKSAQRKLISTLIACSPKVTAQEVGDFLLDASGLLHIGGENTFCHNVLKTCSKNGFIDAYLGVADSAFAAMVAAQLKERRFYIVSKNNDAQFLAPLSIKYLCLPHDIEDTLLNLGIKSMGQLVKLPEEEISKRFGQAGKLAHEWARGYDIRQPYLPEPETIFECSVDMGGAVSSLPESMFAFKSMLDRLTLELKQSGLWAEELVLSLYNEDDNFDERILKLIRPSHQAKFLLEVVKLSLEANPLAREFTRAKLCVSRFSPEVYKQKRILDPNVLRADDIAPELGRMQCAPRGQQQDFTLKALDPTMHHDNNIAPEPGHTWRAPTIEQEPSVGRSGASPPGSEASVSADEDIPVMLLQRFMTRIGENTTVKAVANDQYTFNHAGVWASVQEHSFVDSVIPINVAYINENANEQLVSDLVLRKNPHPLPVLVELKNSVPSAINYNKQWHRIKHITTPEYSSILWWSQGSCKSYYKILVEPVQINKRYDSQRQETQKDSNNQNASLILLAHDKSKNGWYIEGFFD